MTIGRLKSKLEVEFQYGGRSFIIPEVVISQLWLELSLQNLVHLEIVTF